MRAMEPGLHVLRSRRGAGLPLRGCAEVGKSKGARFCAVHPRAVPKSRLSHPPRLFSEVLSSIRKARQVSGCGFVHRSHRNYYTNYYTVAVPPATPATYPSGLITASELANVYHTRLMGSRPPRSPPC